MIISQSTTLVNEKIFPGNKIMLDIVPWLCYIIAKEYTGKEVTNNGRSD
nr:MAG TPA: hypothetical protein [Caudoviricetes sp.]DAG20250.1 MAG TPA: hypothetical protein [Caudoviricetes sp.]